MRRLFSKSGPVLVLALVFAPIAGIGALSAYFEGWHPVFIVLFALGLPMVIVLRVLLEAAWEEWSPKWSPSVTGKEDRPRSVAEDRKWRRMAEDRKALYKLRKEDPETAERIMEDIDSGRASMADLGELVFKARQDALSVEKAEARLRAEGRLPPREPPPADEG